MTDISTIFDRDKVVKSVALALAAEIRYLFNRAMEEDGRMCDAQDPAAELCNAVVSRTLAAFAALTGDDTMADMTRLSHVKSGGLYTVIARGAQVQTDTPLTDYAEVVVYRGDNGMTWVRPVAEMDDGRFAPLAPAPLPGEARRPEAPPTSINGETRHG